MFYNHENFLKKTFNKTCFLSFALCTACWVELGEDDAPLKLDFLLQTADRSANAAASTTAGRTFCISDTWVQGSPLNEKGLGNLKGIQILIKYNYWDTSSC